MYLGQPSGAELRANRPAFDALLADLAQYAWGRAPDNVRAFVDDLGESPVAYLFECPHGTAQLVCWDVD